MHIMYSWLWKMPRLNKMLNLSKWFHTFKWHMCEFCEMPFQYNQLCVLLKLPVHKVHLRQFWFAKRKLRCLWNWSNVLLRRMCAMYKKIRGIQIQLLEMQKFHWLLNLSRWVYISKRKLYRFRDNLHTKHNKLPQMRRL